ncbi:hypothetical protein [Actinocorallia longicatena]|uniref:SPW repeat-containing protein n=1 Tax=Actinocorallia longicatena TaxID=111803 RepID=A0ABP6Q6F1_9ACTN
MALRHAFGFVLGLVLAPALAYGMAWAYVRAGVAVDPLEHTITDRTQLYGAFALMAAVGLVGGVTVVARWASPLVSLMPALAFLGWTVWFLAAPASAAGLPARFPPAGELDAGLENLLASGLFALAGFMLLVPAWTPHRWRARQPEPEETYEYA